jgi:hypothetical protein
MPDFSVLMSDPELWSYWGFEPWASNAMKGVHRRVTIVKDGLLGEVCRYFADDCIVWIHAGEADMRHVLENGKPEVDLMTQRYLFVVGPAVVFRKIRSFYMGFRGYLEVHTYTVHGVYDKRIRDLAQLVDRAWDLASARTKEEVVETQGSLETA